MQTLRRPCARMSSSWAQSASASNGAFHIQKNGGETPTYRITGTSGPPHAPVFEAAVFRGTEEIGSGSGRTKKQAEQAAALSALQRLGKASV